MIELYSGTPGSGKSLHGAKDIRDQLRKKERIVIGNFYVDTKAIKKCQGYYIMVENHRLTPDRLIQFSKRLSWHLKRRLREGEILLMIDEAQLFFNSREWQNIGRQGWLSFFTQHRKYGFNIILMAQFDRMLDRQIRCLIEYECIHRKVSNFGTIGFFVGLVTGNNLYVSVRRWYPIKEKLEMNVFVGKKSLFSIYDTFADFSVPGQPGGMSGDKRGPAIPSRLPEQEKDAKVELEQNVLDLDPDMDGIEMLELEERVRPELQDLDKEKSVFGDMLQILEKCVRKIMKKMLRSSLKS